MRLTVGMAVHTDFDGAWFSTQAMRMFHAEAMRDAEILIIDNNPEHPQGKMLADFMRGWVPGRYIAAPEVQGTAAPRDRVFREAKGEHVVCMDSHVMLWPGALSRLLEYYESHPDCRDMLTGPMMYDNLIQLSTHFDHTWRGEMWGTWATDEQGANPNNTPFEIPAMGLGFFSCRKDAWLGFNPNFRGFGGEEHYIHEKYRQAGHRTLCIPSLRWLHRFGRPSGVPYRLTVWDKARNYYIGHRELGLDPKPIHDHFVKLGLLQQWHWDAIVAGAVTEQDAVRMFASKPVPVEQMTVSANGAVVTEPKKDCGCNAPPKPSIEVWYESAKNTPGDINEHVPTLRELASQCETVVECGTRRGVSTVALLAGKPKRLVSVDTVRTPEVDQLAKLAGNVKFEFVQGDSRAATIPKCDMLFIDTVHTADHLWAELTHLATASRRWIVLHDTVIYGEKGEDGSAGLMAAVRRWVREHPEWTVTRHDRNNHGLLVMSCDDEDKVTPPGLIRKGINFAKAMAEHVADGMKTVEPDALRIRLELCDVCPSRNADVCGECGCPIEKKASWRSSECPLGKWEAVE